MKISLSRRVTAVVAALGLALVAVPAAAPAANRRWPVVWSRSGLHGCAERLARRQHVSDQDAGEVQRHRASVLARLPDCSAGAGC